jgi:hypothetical protein
MNSVTHTMAPFWQSPGPVWNLLPLVPYDSYSEYRILLDSTVEEYIRLIKSGIDSEFDDSMHDRTLKTWLVAHHGLPVTITRLWVRGGLGIFLRLTKGYKPEWCEMMNSLLIHTLDTAARISVNHSLLEFGLQYENEFESDDLISGLFNNEVSRFIHRLDAGIMGAYSLRNLNFIFKKVFRVQGSNESPYDHDDEDDSYYIPTWKFQEIMAAFVMGRHERLGVNSNVRLLDDDLIKIIFTYGVF